MSIGNYYRRCLAYQNKELDNKRSLKKIIATQIGWDNACKIIGLPEDSLKKSNIPKRKTTEENLKLLRKHGFDKILGLN